MGTKVQSVNRENQATPFSQDVIRELQGRLSGAFNTGVGPMQQEAGTAFRQFVNSGGMPQGETLEGMMPALEAVHRRGVDRNAADMREGMGIMGTRLGSTLATGEGRYRAGAEQDWQAQLAQMAQAIQQGNLQRHGLNLGAATQMHSMAQNNILPLLQFAQSGILPPEILASPNPWMQLLTAAVGAGGAYASGGATAAAGRIPQAAQAAQPVAPLGDPRNFMPGGKLY